MERIKIIIAVCLVLAVTFIAFSPCLKNGFVNWDDHGYVFNNEAIHSFSLSNIKKIFGSFFISNYQPLTMLSYSIEYRFFKLNPFWYHLTNLALHLFNTALAFWLIYLLSGKKTAAFLTAILFGIHPLRVESVAWVSERKDVLYALFFLAAIISYCYYLRKGKIGKYYYLALILFLLSCLSKAMAVTLPVVLLLFDYVLHRKPGTGVFLEKIPFFALSIIFGVIGSLGQYSFRAIRMEEIVSLKRLIIAGHSVAFYITKTFFPWGLSCFYSYADIKKNFFFAYIFEMAALSVLTIAVAFSAKFTRKIIFGSLFFLTAAGPVILLPLGSTAAADRYTYIAHIGIFYIAGVAVSCFYRQKLKQGQKRIFSAVLSGILTLLVFLTWQRCRVWKDSVTLWSDAAKDKPCHVVIYKNLGNAYSEAGNNEKAIINLKIAKGINPNNDDVLNDLCNEYGIIGEFDEAIGYCQKTLKLNPLHYRAYYNLGEIYTQTGDTEKAITAYQKAIAVNKEFFEAYNNLASAYADAGRIDEAMGLWEKAVAINPNFAVAHFNLAVFSFQRGDYGSAVKHCDKTLSLGGKVDPKFLFMLEPYIK